MHLDCNTLKLMILVDAFGLQYIEVDDPFPVVKGVTYSKNKAVDGTC